MARLTEDQWEAFLKKFPDAHVLQTAQWGKFKQEYGWTPFFIASPKAGAQILFRTLPLDWKVAYVPKGPLGGQWEELLPELIDICREQRAIVIYVEPDGWENEGEKFLQNLPGFTPSTMTIQPRRTITISLEGDENAWLERMKQKTRYNIHLAEKKGVVVRKSSDMDAFNQLMRITGERDQFGVHQDSYYRNAYEIFHSAGACELFIATYDEQPLAAIMAFKRGRRAWYFYGASNERERNRMPTYLLQWEAMHWAAEAGCKEYDLWGVPDQDEDILEENFTQRSDGLWGVYRFKRGFGGELKRTAGVFERVLNPAVYRVYSSAIKIRKSGFLG